MSKFHLSIGLRVATCGGRRNASVRVLVIGNGKTRLQDGSAGVLVKVGGDIEGPQESTLRGLLPSASHEARLAWRARRQVLDGGQSKSDKS